MQNPPPGPPSGPPPGYPQQPYQPATSSVDKKTGSFLAYVLWWVTGLIMLFVGKGDPDIKYHAAQSVVFFGGITYAGARLFRKIQAMAALEETAVVKA